MFTFEIKVFNLDRSGIDETKVWSFNGKELTVNGWDANCIAEQLSGETSETPLHFVHGINGQGEFGYFADDRYDHSELIAKTHNWRNDKFIVTVIDSNGVTVYDREDQ